MTRRVQSAERRSASAGFTLVEMLVAMAVGLVVSLVLMTTLSMFEGRKRSAGSVADIDNAGALAIAQFDRLIRSAGSGLVQSNANAYGCQLNYSNLLPAVAAFPDPFANVLGTFGSIRVAPVVIASGNTPNAMIDAGLDAGNGSSDVLMVMSGTGGSSSAPANMYTTFNGVPTAASLTLQNTVPFAVNDLVLVMDTATGTGPAPCSLEAVTAVASPTLTLTGVPSLATFSVAGAAVAIGSNAAANGNYPTMQLLGVQNDTANGGHNGLYMYDLLQLSGATSTPVADSVMEVHALYGLATTAGSNVVTCWHDATAPYDAATLMNGSANSNTILSEIKAIRIGLVVKSPLQEKAAGSDVNATGSNAEFSNAYTAPATLTLFQDLATATTGSACPIGAYTRTLSANERQFRYRTVEATIPLRNAFLN